GIMPLRSKKMVDYIDKNLSHIFIPENVRNRMIDKDIEEGICIAQEIIYEIRTIKEAAGVHIYPMNRFSIIPQIIKSDCVDNRILPV
ncbi:MAG: hypothetical protein WCY14_09040, partial [Arcobacteraceae bacterium]